MAIVNMPGCLQSRGNDCKPWTAYKIPDEFYVLSYESIVESLTFSLKNEVLMEKYSGGKIVSLSHARFKRERAVKA